MSRRRMPKWLMAFFVPLGYILIRRLSPLWRILDDAVLLPLVRNVARAMDFFGPIWGAAAGTVVLAGAIWAARKFRRRLATWASSKEATTVFHRYKLIPNQGVAHAQLAIQALLIAIVIPIALRLAGAEDDPVALTVAGLIILTIAFGYLQIRFFVRGGSQRISLGEGGISITNRIGAKHIEWAKLIRVAEQLEREGVKLVSQVREDWIYPVGHRAGDFARMTSLIRGKVATYQEVPAEEFSEPDCEGG